VEDVPVILEASLLDRLHIDETCVKLLSEDEGSGFASSFGKSEVFLLKP